MKYTKYIYWLSHSQFGQLSEQLSDEHIEIKEAKKAVCMPLSRNMDIGYVSPSAWNNFKICNRQLSWYYTSPFIEKYLVISSLQLDEYGIEPECIICDSKFRPKTLPRKKDLKSLLDSPAYNNMKPNEWDKLDAEDDSDREKWLRIMGIGNVTFEEVFRWHCANHANFLDPLYFTKVNNQITPYSICRTTHICSACMEFFNIIGRKFTQKYVVPCPGSVIFSGLSPNRYYRVISTVQDTSKYWQSKSFGFK